MNIWYQLNYLKYWVFICGICCQAKVLTGLLLFEAKKDKVSLYNNHYTNLIDYKLAGAYVSCCTILSARLTLFDYISKSARHLKFVELQGIRLTQKSWGPKVFSRKHICHLFLHYDCIKHISLFYNSLLNGFKILW